MFTLTDKHHLLMQSMILASEWGMLWTAMALHDVEFLPLLPSRLSAAVTELGQQ
jgi:hypothetical protein